MVNRMYNQWIIPNHTEPYRTRIIPRSANFTIWGWEACLGRAWRCNLSCGMLWLHGPWRFGHWLTTSWGCEASVCKMRCSRMETLASLGDAIGLWDNMGPDGTIWDNTGAMVFWCILYRLCPSWLWYTYISGSAAEAAVSNPMAATALTKTALVWSLVKQQHWSHESIQEWSCRRRAGCKAFYRLAIPLKRRYCRLVRHTHEQFPFQNWPRDRCDRNGLLPKVWACCRRAVKNKCAVLVTTSKQYIPSNLSKVGHVTDACGKAILDLLAAPNPAVCQASLQISSNIKTPKIMKPSLYCSKPVDADKSG